LILWRALEAGCDQIATPPKSSILCTRELTKSCGIRKPHNLNGMIHH
jgi:hypothetical protein